MPVTKRIKLAVTEQFATDTLMWEIIKGTTLLKLPTSTEPELDKAAVWFEEWTLEILQLVPPLFHDSIDELAQSFLVHPESIFDNLPTLREKRNEYCKQVRRRVKILADIHHKIIPVPFYNNDRLGY